jgi:hypothetical protein
MDDDRVLRALAEALEQDDPRLAALLRAGPTQHVRRVLAAPPRPTAPPPEQPRFRRRPPRWALWLGGSLAGVLVVLASIPLGLAAFGVLGIVLLMLSPLAACIWCATIDEMRPPERPAGP